jgi:hypothetical protein
MGVRRRHVISDLLNFDEELPESCGPEPHAGAHRRILLPVTPLARLIPWSSP